VWSDIRGRELRIKERLAIPPQEMPVQDPHVRCGNMNEVALGYSEAQVRVEASRCLQCKNAPCIAGCPVHINIPAFIDAAARGEYRRSLGIIKESSLLPAICGRVCPQESQCQAQCTVGKSLKRVDRAVSIGRIERFVADFERLHASGEPEVPAIASETGKRVAVIGSGPASITAAADVRKAGHDVTIFEAFHKPGGVMIYGIPEFRLPKEIVHAEIETLISMGVTVRPNFLIGRTRTLRDLLEKDGFDAVFIGSGAGLPKFMNIPGENLVGVFSANEYLTRANLMKAYDAARAATPIYPSRRVAVIGGGNVAMDAARMALRLGAESVTVVYRRTEAEMPARAEEVAHAKEEGVVLSLLASPVEILANDKGRVRGITLRRYALGEPGEDGRRRPVPISGQDLQMIVDTVIVAIGNESNPLIHRSTPELETDEHGRIVTDEHGKTSLDRVYAGGDIVLGSATVILAMGEGRRAAAAINAVLSDA
jgi:glutamate synthase (NADPH) small chain